MILGAGLLQVPAIKKAKEMGHYVISVDRDRGAPGFVFADKSLEISTNDIDRVIEAAAENDIDAILTLATDLPVRTVAAVVERLGLVGISVDTAFKATNKILMREALRENNVPVPNFYKCTSKEEFLDAVKQIGGKCVCKPADSSGSRGVRMLSHCDSDEMLSDAYYYSREYATGGEVIVEEFMEGPEVSVESIISDDEVFTLAVTDKITTGPPFFVEIGHSQPSQLSSSALMEIGKIAIAAIKTLGICNSAAHTEIIVTDKGPRIVEIGARMGGDHIATHLVPLSTGIDMVKSCIEIALGETPNIEQVFHKGSAIGYLMSPVGRISRIEGVQQAKGMSGVKCVYINKTIGEYSTTVRNSADRTGYIIAQAENVSDAIKVCEEALRNISVSVESDIHTTS